MENLNANHITESVLERLANTPDPRLKEIMLSLVRHLHGFAREVQLTEAEWLKGIEFLTQTGHITNAQRQEFILLSDVLGLSMLTVVMNNDKPDACTQATVLGPFHVEDAPHYKLGDDVANGAKGQPCQVQGSVKGVQGEAVPQARIEVWQSDEKGLYDVQPAHQHHRPRLFRRLAGYCRLGQARTPMRRVLPSTAPRPYIHSEPCSDSTRQARTRTGACPAHRTAAR
jgi:hydroxyquinol 1,2-dioxygenase